MRTFITRTCHTLHAIYAIKIPLQVSFQSLLQLIISSPQQVYERNSQPLKHKTSYSLRMRHNLDPGYPFL